MQQITTNRLLLRPFEKEDATNLFELDSNADVHRYLGNQPVKSMDEIIKVIEFIHQQYCDYGIGRWVVEDKTTGAFMGWSGLKWITEAINGNVHYYDLGYRFKPQFWGSGYATEAAQAWVTYTSEMLNQEKLYAITDGQNKDSQRVLNKLGFIAKENFVYQEVEHIWFEKHFAVF